MERKNPPAWLQYREQSPACGVQRGKALTGARPGPFSTLPADGLYAFDRLYSDGIIDLMPGKRPLIATCSMKPALFLALLVSAACAGPANAQSAAAEGQKLAFDRGKGNCLTCHTIKGGEFPGTIGPELKDIKTKYNRDELIAIVSDETRRNPQTVMPPFGRNRILSEKEIAAVVDFLQTL
jgi:sulfur-oxidizing protein SoxX